MLFQAWQLMYVTLVAFTWRTNPVPTHLVKLLQLIWKSDTYKFHLRPKMKSMGVRSSNELHWFSKYDRVPGE